MKTVKFIISIGLLMTLFVASYAIQKDGDNKKLKIENKRNDSSLENDSVQYKLVVFEPGYENFLVTQLPENYYSENYYRIWNQWYVTEWDDRYATQTASGIYDTYIDYDPKIEYGKDLEYRLYYFFRYFEKKYHVTLVPRNR